MEDVTHTTDQRDRTSPLGLLSQGVDGIGTDKGQRTRPTRGPEDGGGWRTESGTGSVRWESREWPDSYCRKGTFRTTIQGPPCPLRTSVLPIPQYCVLVLLRGNGPTWSYVLFFPFLLIPV